MTPDSARPRRSKRATETRDGVELTNLDVPLSDGDVTKRELIDYLDAVADRLVPVLADRPLSVIRVRPGQPPFMQKNLPAYTPEWVRTTTVWAHASHREIRYALCNDRRTLLWFGNQRAVEFHPTLIPDGSVHPSFLVLDLIRRRARGSRWWYGPRSWSAGLWTRSDWPARSRPAGPRGCTSSCRFGRRCRPRRRRPRPGVGRPGGRAGSGRRDHGVHRAGPRGQGVHRRHPGRRSHGGRRVQPAAASRGPGVLPARLGRVGPGGSGRLHHPQRGPPARRRPIPAGCTRAAAGDASTAATSGRTDRGGKAGPSRYRPGRSSGPDGHEGKRRPAQADVSRAAPAAGSAEARNERGCSATGRRRPGVNIAWPHKPKFRRSTQFDPPELPGSSPRNIRPATSRSSASQPKSPADPSTSHPKRKPTQARADKEVQRRRRPTGT